MNNTMIISNTRQEQIILNLISFLDKNTEFKTICYQINGTLLTVWRNFTGKSKQPIVVKNEYDLLE